MTITEALREAREAGQRAVRLPSHGITVILEPEVTLVAGTRFEALPDDIQERWSTDAPEHGGEALLEAAGRACYQSWHNPAGRTNHEYLANIVAQGHGSVLEHANYSVYLRGVSRSLTHELVRHRAGCSYSQLSQRYVDSSEVAFVIPPALLAAEELLPLWADACARALEAYQGLTEGLQGRIEGIKKRREAARAVLPNCTETHIVMTANIRAWRHILAMRGSEHAEAEIRRLSAAILPVLSGAVPAFWDYHLGVAPDGFPTVTREDEA